MIEEIYLMTVIMVRLEHNSIRISTVHVYVSELVCALDNESIIESVDSISREGPDTPIYVIYIYTKSKIIQPR